MEKKKLNRLESLDVLRGFDLFCLVVLEMPFLLSGVGDGVASAGPCDRYALV